MDPIVTANGILRPCCADPANLARVNSSTDAAGNVRTHDRCSVCGRNHYGMEIEPVKVGAALA